MHLEIFCVQRLQLVPLKLADCALALFSYIVLKTIYHGYLDCLSKQTHLEQNSYIRLN